MAIFGGGRHDQVSAYLTEAMPRLLATARALTGREADAEDLLQDTVVKVLRNWGRVEQADNRNAYVRTIMVNTFVSGRRRRDSSELVASEVVEAVLTPSAGPALGVEHGPLWTRVLGLPRQQRAVLVLRYLEDLPDAQIAEILGVSESTVRVTAHRGLATLRSHMAVA